MKCKVVVGRNMFARGCKGVGVKCKVGVGRNMFARGCKGVGGEV